MTYDTPDTGIPLDDTAHPVGVISAAILKAARTGYLEDHADFARGVSIISGTAGVTGGLVAAIEDGSRPVWSLPGTVRNGIYDHVAVYDEDGLADMLELGSLCDLLLTEVLDGIQDLVFALDGDGPLTGTTASRGRELLHWAITGTPPVARYISLPDRPLLSPPQLALLGETAAALASSGGPAAWVGTELAAMFGIA